MKKTPSPASESGSAVPTITAAKEVIRLTAGEWRPFISETMENYGPFTQVVTEAFALEGVAVQYRFFPWKRAVRLAREGVWDGSIAIVHTQERETVFWYNTEPVMVGRRVFFHLKERPFDWSGIEDLAGLHIGATLEYYYGAPFEMAEKTGRIRVDRVPTDLQNFGKILRGRVDIFPLTREVGLYLLRTEFSPEEAARVTHHPLPLSAIPFYIILSRKVEKNERLLEAFNRGFRRLKESGRYDRIFWKWNF